eukprot:9040339-Pyramimonas_sp.AAC.1
MGTTFPSMRSRLQGQPEVRSRPTQFHSSPSQSAYDDIIGPGARQLSSGIMDISSAFLERLKFDELTRNSKKLDLDIREKRSVYIMPPANVWRHLRDLSKLFDTPDSDAHLYVLECIKPVRGL